MPGVAEDGSGNVRAVGEARPSAPPGGRPRYRFFGGKGGVGKTTCAAASALDAAERGRRVLLVSTDPAHSLADALARPLSSAPRRVATRRGRLLAVELDADRALARWLDLRRPALRAIAERGTYLDEADLDPLLRLSFPGVDELVGLVELTRLAQRTPSDQILVDTAPTGHTLRLLGMPASLTRIGAVLDHMHAKHRFLAESLGGGHRPDACDALIAEVAAQGRELAGLLRHPDRATVTWVLTPEPAAIEETADALAALQAAGIAVDELVVNRVPARCSICPRCRPRWVAAKAALAEIRGRFRGKPVRLVPEAEAEPRGPAGLRPIGRVVAGGPPSPPAASSAAPHATRGDERTGRSGAPRRAARATRLPGKAARLPREAGGGPGEAAWLDLVAPPGMRLLVVAGKGGVGKTTCATTVALTRARGSPGRRVLLLSADPAHSLGDVLGMPADDRVRAVPGARRVFTRELDAEAAFRARRARYQAAVDRLFDRWRGGASLEPAFDRRVMRELIDLAPSGLDELFAVLAVVEALAPAEGGPPFDTVVLDTAPTGHALRLLAFPGEAREWVRTLLAILLKYRQVVGLGDLGQDLVEVARGLRRLEALLVTPAEAGVLVVTAPGELPRLETRRLLRRLDELGIAVTALVVNGVTGRGCARCGETPAAETRALTAIGRLRVGGRRPPLVVAPRVAPPPRGADGLLRWGLGWEVRRR